MSQTNQIANVDDSLINGETLIVTHLTAGTTSVEKLGSDGSSAINGAASGTKKYLLGGMAPTGDSDDDNDIEDPTGGTSEPGHVSDGDDFEDISAIRSEFSDVQLTVDKLLGLSFADKSLVLYRGGLIVCRDPRNFNDAKLFLDKLAKYSLKANVETKDVKFDSYQDWRDHISSLLAKQARYGNCYDLCTGIKFSRLGADSMKFTSEKLDVDFTWAPYYITYTVKSASSSVMYNPPLEWHDSIIKPNGKKAPAEFIRNLQLQFILSHAMLFVSNKNAQKGYSIRDLLYSYRKGKDMLELTARNVFSTSLIEGAWSAGGSDIMSAFGSWIYYCAREGIMPNVTHRGATMWATAMLLGFVKEYEIQLSNSTEYCVKPDDILKSARYLRHGTVLDIGFNKDSDRMFAMAQCDDGTWVKNLTVVDKILLALKRVESVEAQQLVYAGVADHDNNQVAYVRQWCVKRSIKFVSFDITPRIGNVCADASNYDDMCKLFGSVDKDLVTAVLCDISFDIKNDNAIPMAIMDNIFLAAKACNVRFSIMFHKCTLNGSTPKSTAGLRVEYMIDQDKEEIVSFRTHNFESLLMAYPSETGKVAALNALTHPKWLQTAYAHVVLKWLVAFQSSNLFRGVQYHEKQFGKKTFTTFYSNYEFAKLEFMPVSSKILKTKRDDIGSMLEENDEGIANYNVFHDGNNVYVEIPVKEDDDFKNVLRVYSQLLGSEAVKGDKFHKGFYVMKIRSVGKVVGQFLESLPKVDP